MPGGHTRNARLSVSQGTREWYVHWGHDRARLSRDRMDSPSDRLDFISVVADDLPGRDAVYTIMSRKYETPARTLARRRETVQRAQEAADVQGWTLTADERTMLEAF
jgi:hypothetical protein